MQGEESGIESRLNETESEGLSHALFNIRGIIEPGTRIGGSHKAGEALNSHLPEQASQGARVAGQGVEQVSDSHQVVVATHGIPVLGEGVFVGIALVLFDQDAALDAPAVAPSQITALVDIVAIERAAGEPGVFGGFGDDLSMLIDLLPLFFTEHEVDDEVVFSVLPVFVANLSRSELLEKQG